MDMIEPGMGMPHLSYARRTYTSIVDTRPVETCQPASKESGKDCTSCILMTDDDSDGGGDDDDDNVDNDNYYDNNNNIQGRR